MLHILKLVPGILVVEITGMLYTRHHQWVTLDVSYLLHGTRVTRRDCPGFSSKMPCMATHIKPGILKAGKPVICICGIAKFETGALYITYNYIINDSSRM